MLVIPLSKGQLKKMTAKQIEEYYARQTRGLYFETAEPKTVEPTKETPVETPVEKCPGDVGCSVS